MEATLCIPKLMARLAVSEASLQRLHGSLSEGQPETAQLGSWAAPRPPAQAGLPSATEAGQERPASASPGKQQHAASCRCAQWNDSADKGHCQIGQILGIDSSKVCCAAGWDSSFEPLGVMLTCIPMAAMPDDDDVSCAQHCASMAEVLRRALKGLPVSSLGAATACLVAKIASVVAGRYVHQDVSALTASFAVSGMPCPQYGQYWGIHRQCHRSDERLASHDEEAGVTKSSKPFPDCAPHVLDISEMLHRNNWQSCSSAACLLRNAGASDWKSSG